MPIYSPLLEVLVQLFTPFPLVVVVIPLSDPASVLPHVHAAGTTMAVGDIGFLLGFYLHPHPSASPSFPLCPPSSFGGPLILQHHILLLCRGKWVVRRPSLSLSLSPSLHPIFSNLVKREWEAERERETRGGRLRVKGDFLHWIVVIVFA